MSDIQVAIQKMQSGQWIEAITILSGLNETFEVCNFLGIAHQMNQNWMGARLAWEKSFHFDSSSEDVLLNLGIACVATNDKVSAEKYWKLLEERNPTHTGCLINLGLIYREWEQNQKAHDCWEKVLDAVPSHSKIIEWLADVKGVLAHGFLQKGEVIQAEALLKNAVSMDPSHAMLWRCKTELHVLQGDLSQALSAARRASDLEPKDPEAYDLLSKVFQEMGDEKSALEMRMLAQRFK